MAVEVSGRGQRKPGGGGRRKHRQPQPRGGAPRASAVTITRADSTVTIVPPYTAAHLRRLAPERLPIGDRLRAAILRRDRGCRYCGSVTGPFEIDHVIPVCKGGQTIKANLVTACLTCNRRKGGEVWQPNPLIAVSARLRSPDVTSGGSRLVARQRFTSVTKSQVRALQALYMRQACDIGVTSA